MLFFFQDRLLRFLISISVCKKCLFLPFMIPSSLLFPSPGRSRYREVIPSPSSSQRKLTFASDSSTVESPEAATRGGVGGVVDEGRSFESVANVQRQQSRGSGRLPSLTEVELSSGGGEGPPAPPTHPPSNVTLPSPAQLRQAPPSHLQPQLQQQRSPEGNNSVSLPAPPSSSSSISSLNQASQSKPDLPSPVAPPSLASPSAATAPVPSSASQPSPSVAGAATSASTSAPPVTSSSHLSSGTSSAEEELLRHALGIESVTDAAMITIDELLTENLCNTVDLGYLLTVDSGIFSATSQVT